MLLTLRAFLVDENIHINSNDFINMRSRHPSTELQKFSVYRHIVPTTSHCVAQLPQDSIISKAYFCIDNFNGEVLSISNWTRYTMADEAAICQQYLLTRENTTHDRNISSRL